MLVVVERLTDGEIITIFILCFNVSLKYTLYLLNIEGTDVQQVNRLDSSATSEIIFVQEFGW
jgi:hypothetical protein